MYKIIFYRDKNGTSEVEEYIKELSAKRNTSKDFKIKFTKVVSYIDLLSRNGFELNAPYIKHIDAEIWELRPLRDRILFAYWDKNKFILLNHFMKKTQKTPEREIEKAKRLLQEYKRRSCNKNE